MVFSEIARYANAWVILSFKKLPILKGYLLLHGKCEDEIVIANEVPVDNKPFVSI